MLRTGPRSGGIDEAGRGPLLGSVYAACVVLPDEFDDERDSKPLHAWIRDSKKLSAKRRENVAEYVRRNAVAWGVGSATTQEIDRMNIANATFLAMHRAYDAAAAGGAIVEELLVDGPRFVHPSRDDVDGYFPRVQCICDGDATHMAIAAASILAKVAHDAYIRELVAADPTLDARYGLARNMGYGTPIHMAGLRLHGAVPGLHRCSFAPVRQVTPARPDS